jgi:hypothetical protein
VSDAVTPGGDLDAAVEAHARRIVTGDPAARVDLAPGAQIEPADLVERLLAGPWRGFERVAHARIGAYHVIKTRYLGRPTLVVQERWVRDPDGGWRIREAELTRVAPDEES